MDCSQIDPDKALRAIQKTRETGNEHAFAVCADGTHSEIVSGTKRKVKIEVDCAETAGIFHVHPNDVMHLSDQDLETLEHDKIDMVCVADTQGNMKCEMDEEFACVSDLKDQSDKSLESVDDAPQALFDDGDDKFALAVLPKGSRCIDTKPVKSRSSYHNSDTVDRCDNFSTPGKDKKKSDDSDDDSDVPSSVGGYDRKEPEYFEEKVDPVWDVVHGWAYTGGRPRDYDGHIYVYVLDTGDSDKTSRYQFGRAGDDIRKTSMGGRSDDLEETTQAAIDWMEENDPRTPIPDFDVTIPNAILKPLSKTANRMGHGARIEVSEVSKQEGGFKALQFEGGGGMSMWSVSIPTKKIDGKLGKQGAMYASIDALYNVAKDTKKSDDIRVWFSDGRLRFSAEDGGQRSTEYKHEIEYSGATGYAKGPADGQITTTGRNYRKAVKALEPIPHRDTDAVAVHTDGDDARLILETDYGTGPAERARAPLNITDDEPYEVSGSATIGVEFQYLEESSKSVQRPASTTVNLFLYEDTDEQTGTMVVEYIDEDCRFNHRLAAQKDTEEYDLSMIEEIEQVSYCPFADRGLELEQPDLDLESGGEMILWFHPKAEGCRCSSQALQFNELAENHDAKVIGVNTESEAHNETFREKFDLSFPIVSDPDHDLIDKFDVSVRDDGRPERTTVFVRNGEVVDRVEGMFSLESDHALAECACGTDEEPPEVLEYVEHPSVVTITGQRRAGKSSLAYHIAEEMHKHRGVRPVTVNVPESTAENLPDHWVHVSSISQAPKNSVVVYDESYRSIHSRTPMSDENIDLTEVVELSAQRGQSILFVTQNSAILDKVAVGESDVMMIKKPGKLSMKFERSSIRELSKEARERFEMLPEDADHRAYTYIYGEDGEAFVQNDEADFYSDDISRSFACRDAPDEKRLTLDHD